MGKRKKRMMKAKYAKKYALKRAALGFDKIRVKNALIMIDPNGEEEKQEEAVQVVTNTPSPLPSRKNETILDPEPQLIEVEQPVEQTVEEIAPPKPKTTRKRRARRKTTKSTTTKTTASSTTTRRRRSASKTKD